MSFIFSHSLKPLPITFRKDIVDMVINNREPQYYAEDIRKELELLYPELHGKYITKPIPCDYKAMEELVYKEHGIPRKSARKSKK